VKVRLFALGLCGAFFLYTSTSFADGDRCKANQAECDRQRKEQSDAHKADKPAKNAEKAYGGKK
jgi:hypothetical protein